jgi:hypothetical protein
LKHGDVRHLSRAVDFADGLQGEEFKPKLLATLRSSYDTLVTGRLIAAVEALDEDEIRWLCENPEMAAGRHRRGGRR